MDVFADGFYVGLIFLGAAGSLSIRQSPLQRKSLPLVCKWAALYCDRSTACFAPLNRARRGNFCAHPYPLSIRATADEICNFDRIFNKTLQVKRFIKSEIPQVTYLYILIIIIHLFTNKCKLIDRCAVTLLHHIGAIDWLSSPHTCQNSLFIKNTVLYLERLFRFGRHLK